MEERCKACNDKIDWKFDLEFCEHCFHLGHNDDETELEYDEERELYD